MAAATVHQPARVRAATRRAGGRSRGAAQDRRPRSNSAHGALMNVAPRAAASGQLVIADSRRTRIEAIDRIIDPYAPGVHALGPACARRTICAAWWRRFCSRRWRAGTARKLPIRPWQASSPRATSQPPMAIEGPGGQKGAAARLAGRVRPSGASTARGIGTRHRSARVRCVAQAPGHRYVLRRAPGLTTLIVVTARRRVPVPSTQTPARRLR